jgi:16S rRNA A1518/A1519 N6-dimethyltransferase RsmA/KsgA/DIM1 with predicted DNA glycosylase/AP lyase activity
MLYAYLTVVFLVMCFSVVLLFGAPYLPTLSKQKETALDLLDLRPGQTLLELGSGDGRVLLAAAKRGIKTVGIELNPILFVISLIVTFRYRKDVKIIWGNFWSKKWPETDGIFVFLLDKYMPKLDKRIKTGQRKPTKVASFAFEITGKKPTKEKDGVFLYGYG